MEAIDLQKVQKQLDCYLNQEIYFHLETSNGSYASLQGEEEMSVCAFIRNGKLKYSHGIIKGSGPYSVGLKLKEGWVYAEGLTDYEVTSDNQLLLGGYDHEGRVNIALELSSRPFKI
ncbi:YojF family protein [Heyndrickxia coagulans]|uniref:YojF family protein n=1 Tax=Heyndrickxia coagulans TaxID=1398 RepID=UPI0003F71C96|nr:YojF family protein [Heyndrickxia coagulans]